MAGTATKAAAPKAAPVTKSNGDALAFILGAISKGVTFHDETTAVAVHAAIAELGDGQAYAEAKAKADAKAKAQAVLDAAAEAAA